MYGNVAHGMSLVNRKTLQLSADFGEALGHAFLAETQIPKSVRDAARDASAEVGTDLLRSWGLRAGLASESGTEAAATNFRIVSISPPTLVTAPSPWLRHIPPSHKASRSYPEG